MNSIYGVENIEAAKALLDICFSNSNIDRSLSLIDNQIQNDLLSREHLRLLPLIKSVADISSLSTFSQSRISGIYKHTLYRNHLLLARAHSLQISLCDTSFGDMLFLKGIPSALIGRGGIGSRPMSDVDILIPNLNKYPSSVLEKFNSLGFIKKNSGVRSITFISPDGFEFDIHWLLHDWALDHSLIDSIFDYSELKKFQNTHYKIPCIEHHLAHVITHGVMTPELNYDGRWVADVLQILRSSTHIKKDTFLEFANKFAAPLVTRDAINLLIDQVPGSIMLDRNLLQEMASGLRKNNRFISWAYNRTPVPNIAPHNRIPIKRVDWIKLLCSSYLITTYQLYTKNQIPLIECIPQIMSFPPKPFANSILLLIKKACTRIPELILNKRRLFSE